MADGSPKAALPTDLRPAFDALYRQHAPMVRRALRQLGVPAAGLEDATQDVFVVLHRRLDDFDRGRSLTNWLWGIARGVASSHRRSERRRARLHDALPRPAGHDPLDRGIARRQASSILDQFLGSLDADKCAVFVLSELEGRRGPEIARMLEVNVNTVYARLRAARKRFDTAMEANRESRSRPLFAWLPWAWPVSLGKPVVAVGVGALVTAVTLTGPRGSEPVPSAPVTLAAFDPPVARASSPSLADDRRRDRSRGRGLEPESVVPEPEPVVLDDEGPTARPRSSSGSKAAAETTAVLEPVESGPEPVLDPDLDPDLDNGPELVVGPPPRAPWGSRIESMGHRPVHHPELVTPRRDFVDELRRVARTL